MLCAVPNLAEPAHAVCIQHGHLHEQVWVFAGAAAAALRNEIYGG